MIHVVCIRVSICVRLVKLEVANRIHTRNVHSKKGILVQNPVLDKLLKLLHLYLEYDIIYFLLFVESFFVVFLIDYSFNRSLLTKRASPVSFNKLPKLTRS